MALIERQPALRPGAPLRSRCTVRFVGLHGNAQAAPRHHQREPQGGSVATSNRPVRDDGQARVAVRISGGWLEHIVDELILMANIGPAHPSNLSPPHHVDHFLTLNRSSRGLELSESLLGVHSSFDGAMVLLNNVVQVLHGSVPTATAESSFPLSCPDRGGIDGCQIRDNDAWLWMRSVAQSLAK